MKKICISGASGYLASHTIIKLLENDFLVKGLTRNKQQFYLDYYDCLKKHLTNTNKLSNLEIIEYNYECLEDDKLINILNDCNCLIHCASPVILNDFNDISMNMSEIINPAIKYTEAILTASLFTNIKKVIFVSSTTTIYDGTKTKYNSDYFADLTKIKDAYSISKIKSEKLAWKIYNENKKWELVVVNPGRIIGPVIYNKIPESYCSIIEAIHLSKTTENEGINNYYSSYCDVRDVANIIVYGVDNLNTNRYIISFEIKEFKDYCDLLTDKKYNYIFKDNIFEYDNSFKDYKYIPFEKSIKDSLNSIKSLIYI